MENTRNFETYCRDCGHEYTVEEGDQIICPICECIQDMKGNRYSNNFSEGDIIEFGSYMAKKYEQAVYIRKSQVRKHWSVVFYSKENREIHTVARAALNPHID